MSKSSRRNRRHQRETKFSNRRLLDRPSYFRNPDFELLSRGRGTTIREIREAFRDATKRVPSPLSYLKREVVQSPEYRSFVKNIRRVSPGFTQLHDEIKKTVVCARRAMRIEVLHALKKTGKGQGRRKRPKFNDDSKISCKRR